MDVDVVLSNGAQSDRWPSDRIASKERREREREGGCWPATTGSLIKTRQDSIFFFIFFLFSLAAAVDRCHLVTLQRPTATADFSSLFFFLLLSDIGFCLAIGHNSLVFRPVAHLLLLLLLLADVRRNHSDQSSVIFFLLYNQGNLWAGIDCGFYFKKMMTNLFLLSRTSMVGADQVELV